MSTYDNFKKRTATKKAAEFAVNKKDILGTPGTPAPSTSKKQDQPKTALKPSFKPKKPGL